jgi:hypothetical protein
MKIVLVNLIVLLVGVAIGVFGNWAGSHYVQRTVVDQQELLEQLMSYSDISISDNNYACEGRAVRTVGAVISSQLEMNAANTRNKLSYGCFENTCTMSISDCKPWQDQECSSRFLRFDIDERNRIVPETFNCFDMP